MLLLEGDEPKKEPASSADPGALEAEIARREKERKARTPRQEREARVPEHLPAVDEVIEPEEVKADPQAWRPIGEEVTEQLDYSPARYFRRRIIRKKYVKRNAPLQAPVIAELNTLQERSIAGPGLLAHIIVSKYCDHLPLYRQEQIAQLRHELNIPRQSMARWLGMASDWLEPIHRGIRAGVMAGGYVQGDETCIKYLDPGNGQTSQGYFWAFKRPGGDAFFEWRTSRAAECLRQIIPAELTQPPPPEASGSAQHSVPSVSRLPSALGSAARCSAMATAPIRPLPDCMEVGSPWPRAGRMCGASSTKPKTAVASTPPSSSCRSSTFTGWSQNCAKRKPVHVCGKPRAAPRASRSSSASAKRWPS